ncbi:MAG: metallophosphoesterase family protein [Pseudomonadota bacterium]
MQIADILELGHLEGEVIVFGGPVSNLHATEAFLQRMGAEGRAPRQVICTGDLAAYCGHPAETIAAVRAFGCAVVAGNCEEQLAGAAKDCGCGFGDGTACDALSGAWYAHAAAAVTDDQRQWMADLPKLVTFTHARGRFAVIHGGAQSINRFIWSTSPEDLFAEEIATLRARLGDIDGVFAGHSGIAFQRSVDSVHWINAGSIGMPPHDSRDATRYARLTNDGVLIERLAYDAAAARAAMESVGLTQGYHRTLTDGLWPSEDVLPAELKQVA